MKLSVLFISDEKPELSKSNTHAVNRHIALLAMPEVNKLYVCVIVIIFLFA